MVLAKAAKLHTHTLVRSAAGPSIAATTVVDCQSIAQMSQYSSLYLKEHWALPRT
jgi:hypothetical protein